MIAAAQPCESSWKVAGQLQSGGKTEYHVDNWWRSWGMSYGGFLRLCLFERTKPGGGHCDAVGVSGVECGRAHPSHRLERNGTEDPVGSVNLLLQGVCDRRTRVRCGAGIPSLVIRGDHTAWTTNTCSTIYTPAVRVAQACLPVPHQDLPACL